MWGNDDEASAHQTAEVRPPYDRPCARCRKMCLGNRELVNLHFTTEHGETVVAWGEVATSGCEVIIKSPAARVLMAPRRPLLLHVERA